MANSKPKDCTLILTEGDSAKALAVAGLAVIGRDKYGELASVSSFCRQEETNVVMVLCQGLSTSRQALERPRNEPEITSGKQRGPGKLWPCEAHAWLPRFDRCFSCEC